MSADKIDQSQIAGNTVRFQQSKTVMGTSINTFSRWPIRAFKRKIWKVASRSPNPYATHVPVLVACAHVFKPARILELGSGRNSTPLFLNREIFTDVVEVLSLENDAQWFGKLDDLKDVRLERRLVDGAISDAIESIDCSRFDLVFVDDSRTARERKRTLDSLRRRVGGHQIIVAHDFDLWPIRLALYSYASHHGIVALTPHCGFAWNKRSVCRETLSRVDEVVRASHTRIEEDDAMGWRNQFIESMPDAS